MSAEANEAIEAEVQRIDAAIRRSGFWLMNEDQLTLLLGDAGTGLKTFAKLALERGWSLEFHPHDREVRISLLPLPSPSPA
jgi:hypothetical protein